MFWVESEGHLYLKDCNQILSVPTVVSWDPLNTCRSQLSAIFWHRCLEIQSFTRIIFSWSWIIFCEMQMNSWTDSHLVLVYLSCWWPPGQKYRRHWVLWCNHLLWHPWDLRQEICFLMILKLRKCKNKTFATYCAGRRLPLANLDLKWSPLN